MFEGEQTEVCVSILDRELTTAEERHFAVATRQLTNNAALGTVRKYIHVYVQLQHCSKCMYM